MTGPEGPATVSTVQEAERFADAGVRDMIYAVGIAPSKLDRVAALRRRGVDLAVLLDSREQAEAVAAFSRATGASIPALIEIDTDGHRAGVRPDDPMLIEIGRILADGAELRGVLTHGGGSYDGRLALEEAAELERAGAVRAAERLRAAGLSCPVVSVGSTPTAHLARDLTGVTEVRAGVFVFFDLFMAGLGVCTPDDLALSVLATVIGRQADKGGIITDAGWMAMSQDRATRSQALDQGYGIVCDAAGRPIPDLVMTGASQEHGVLRLRDEAAGPLPDLPVGTLLRIYPNHACATAAQHDRYHVVRDGEPGVRAVWERFGGW
jgi:D-serine deaminase-like pyridoxal phosphate-dependent protein